MGCGASKNVENQVIGRESKAVATNKVAPEPANAQNEVSASASEPCSRQSSAASSTQQTVTHIPMNTDPAQTIDPVATNASTRTNSASAVDPALGADAKVIPRKGSTLSRAVIPSIPYVSQSDAAKGTHKAVAFEIPLDEDLLAPAADLSAHRGVAPVLGNSLDQQLRTSIRASLPKLAISEKDIQAKLANTEARWRDLEVAHAERSTRHRGTKPSLTHNNQKTTDPQTLRQRLAEKEAIATNNRAREISKMQSKLARQEERARRVQERKRALGRHSDEALNLSWGGEDGLETILAEVEKLGSSDMSSTPKKDQGDGDSGLGSSLLGSRSGSGRSVGTNGEIINDVPGSVANADAVPVQ